MTFDLRTIYAMTALACFVLGLVQAAICMSGRFERWLAWWSVSNILIGLGHFCIVFRDNASAVITIQLGNLLTIAGCVLLPAAVRIFAGRPVDPLRCGLLVVLLYLPMLVAFPDGDDALARVVYGSLIFALLDLAIAHEGLRLARSEGLYAARLMAGLFVVTALLYVARAALGAAGWFGTHGLFDSGSNNHALMGLLAMVFLALRGMIIMLMAAERAANQLREAAHHDPLTGVLNRGGLLDALRSRPPDRMAVLLVDLDHFKQLNDSGGHALGDRILCLFASCAMDIASKDDFVARHGGDEFVILLRRRSLGEALTTAEVLRSGFARALSRIDGPLPIEPTLSIGVAAARDHEEQLEALLQRADQALYRVKRRGRDGAEACGADGERFIAGGQHSIAGGTGVKNEAAGSVGVRLPNAVPSYALRK